MRKWITPSDVGKFENSDEKWTNAGFGDGTKNKELANTLTKDSRFQVLEANWTRAVLCGS
jgi:hypothetical protein